MKNWFRTPASLLLLLWTSSLCPAGTVILKSGEEVEGRILRAGVDSVTIETRFSETIMEERVIPRDEIREIKRVPVDLKQFEEIVAEGIPETAVSEEAYNSITNSLNGFVASFRHSSKISDARAMLAQIEREKQMVRDGNVKLEGVWLSEQEMKEESVQLEALRLFRAMKAKAKAGDIRSALNDFLQLEKKAPGSVVYPDAVESARTYLRQLSHLLEHEIRNYPILEQERKRRMELESAAVQRNMESAREREIERAKQRIEQAKSADQTFFPYSTVYLNSMENLLSVVQREENRLALVGISTMNRSKEEMNRARRLYEERELTAARHSVERSLELWPENELAQRLSTQIDASIEAREKAAELQRAAVEEGFTSRHLDPDAGETEEPEEENGEQQEETAD